MLNAFNMQKTPMIGLLVIAIMLLQVANAYSQQSAQTKPNILIIITDDQNYKTIHALGNKEIITPNMDRLVNEGTAFTQTHIMGGLNGAICCPSRAMILSGKTLFRIHADGANIPASDTTFPEAFRAKGYTTFETGKWHQDKASFNRSFATGKNILFAGMNPLETGGQYRPKLNNYDSTGEYKTPFWGNDYSSVHFADAAIEFLQQQKENNTPFLMYVSFTSPHDPRTPPSWYGHSYRPGDVSLPANYLPEHPFDNGELVIRDEMLLPFPRTKEAVKTELAKYYAMVSEVDEQIGRVLDMLAKTGKDKNTIVVFAGDNGLAVGGHGLLGKQNPYECSIRVPLIFRGPGIPKGKKVDQYVYLNDIYRTVCEMSGINVPSTVEGISLSGAFTSQSFKGRDKAFFAYTNLQRAIVRDGYKFIRYNVNGQSRAQLFDLNKDPNEITDLSGKTSYASMQKELSDLLSNTMTDLNDFCDPQKPDWGHPKKWTYNEVIKFNP
jgi:arylsulfatase A-like enzyme